MMLTWVNTYLPAERSGIEILTADNEIKIACVEWVYDSDRDPNNNTPKWWCEAEKINYELRDVIAWRYYHKDERERSGAEVLKAKVRRALAAYMDGEDRGVNSDFQDRNARELAKLLDMDLYEDESGVDYDKYL